MNMWKTTVQATPGSLHLLMTDPEHNEVLKAVLPPIPAHPRALLTLLEGLALWIGHPLTAAVFAPPRAEMRCVEALFGDGLVPIESALVRFELFTAPRKPRKLRGISDFRATRVLHGRWS